MKGFVSSLIACQQNIKRKNKQIANNLKIKIELIQMVSLKAFAQLIVCSVTDR